MPTPTAVVEPDPSAPMPPWLARKEEVAALLNIKLRTLERRHAAGKLPAPRRISAVLMWDVEELRAWLSRPKADGRLMTRAEWAPVWRQLVRTKK